MLTVLDLFSGIGGFSLGLERTGGFKTVAFCEIDKAAQKVLRKHWPDVPIYEDVSKLTGKDVDGTVDVICGGFPCQDLSFAGRGAGLEGERSGLWWELHRIISEVKPKYALIENVSALRSRGLDKVLRSLAEIGYDAEWHCIPASFIGAWHRRDRIWLLAYPCDLNAQGSTKEPLLRQSHLQVKPTRGFTQWPGRSNLPESRFLRSLNGFPGSVDRLKQLGNAVVPQIPELIGMAILEREKGFIC